MGTLQSKFKETVQKLARPCMSLSVRPDIKNTTFRMMLLNARPSKTRNVKMSPKVTPLNRNVLNGPVMSVDQEPLKFPDKRNALIEKKLSSKKFPRKHVTWNHKDNASTSLNWYLFLNLSKSALISPRRSAPAPVLTQEKFKSLLSRNGAMFQLLNLVLLKHFTRSKMFHYQQLCRPFVFLRFLFGHYVCLKRN